LPQIQISFIDNFASSFYSFGAMNEKIWNKDFVLLILSNFLMYITYYAILSALPIYLVSYLHASKMQVGIVVGAYTIASVIVRPFSGFALDKFGRRTIFLSGLVIYSLLFAGYLVAITITSIIFLRFAQDLPGVLLLFQVQQLL